MICKVIFDEEGTQREIIGRMSKAQYFNKDNDFVTIMNYTEKTILRDDIISITVLEVSEFYCLV